MSLIQSNNTYGNDLIQSFHSNIRTWNQQATSKWASGLKGIASIPAHLVTAALVGPSLVIYDIAMAIFKGISSLVCCSKNSDAMSHLKSIPEVGKYMLISLVSCLPTHVGYNLEDAWNAKASPASSPLPSQDTLKPSPADQLPLPPDVHVSSFLNTPSNPTPHKSPGRPTTEPVEYSIKRSNSCLILTSLQEVISTDDKPSSPKQEPIQSPTFSKTSKQSRVRSQSLPGPSLAPIMDTVQSIPRHLKKPSIVPSMPNTESPGYGGLFPGVAPQDFGNLGL